MRFDIVTIFPGFFAGFFEHGIVRRAQAAGLVTVETHDLREHAHDRHRTVDDRPFGGGEGMVLKPGPLAEALERLGIRPKTERESSKSASQRVSELAVDEETTEKQNAGPSTSTAAAASAQDDNSVIEPGDGAFSAQDDINEERVWPPTLDAEKRAKDGATGLEGGAASLASGTRVILLSAQGRLFTQSVARELAGVERVVLICGRYEGVDERINELYCDMELSIGDYVLSGGELAAAVVVDATMRLIPGVLGNEASGEFESFGAADAEIAVDVEGVPRSQHGAGGLLDYPQYTRPAEFGGLRAPEVLMNGDHAEIRRWRRQQQLRKTLMNRPELLERAQLSAEDLRMLETIRGGEEV